MKNDKLTLSDKALLIYLLDERIKSLENSTLLSAVELIQIYKSIKKKLEL